MSSATVIAAPAPAPAPPSLASRLLSLDLLRGATIAGMILVNNAGDEQSSYWPLQHAHWNGWTPTDLIFPFFLFMVGVATAFSLFSRLQRGVSRQQLLKHILWRGFLLFAIGVFLNGFPSQALATWRIYGVLQRIAICYTITAVLVLWIGPRGRWITIFTCLAGYWVMMRYIPVPGFGVPTHGMPLLDPDRNLAAWLDRKLLMGHLYEVTRDPEGVLSTIPALGTSLLGVATGECLRSGRSPRTKALGMAVFGIAGFAAGEIMNIWFPINKKLWTSSFVVLSAGLALICLSLCYWVLDIKQWRGSWTKPFLVFGTNSIAAYVFGELMAHLLTNLYITLADGNAATLAEAVYERVFVPYASPANASLGYAVAYVLMCWLAMWVLYRQRIFIKI